MNTSNFCSNTSNNNNNNSNINNNNYQRIIKKNQEEIYSSIGWGFNYILEKENFDNDNKLLNWMNNNNVLKGLLEISKCEEYNNGALRAIGTILSGSNDKYTSLCINLGCIDVYKHNLSICWNNIMLSNNSNYYDYYYEKLKFKPIQEICWAISNITAGTKKQIESIFKSKLFPILIKILSLTPYQCSKESMWAIANATECKEIYIISYLCKINVIPSICSFLNKFIINNHFETKQGEDLLNNAILLAIENILLLSDSNNNNYIQQFEEGNVDEYLTAIQGENLNNTSINNKIDHILMTYFDDDEMTQPNDDDINNPMNNISFQGHDNNGNTMNGNNSGSRQFGNQFGFGYQGQNNNNNQNDDNDENDQPFNF